MHLESPEVRSRTVVAVVAGILFVLVLIGFGFERIFPDRVGKTFTVSTPFPDPQVVPNERDERLRIEARQRRFLTGGNGHMPIDRAMKEIAAKGPNAFDPLGEAP